MATKSLTVVLFGYESSTFTLKVRLALRLKGIKYSFVTVPSMMPRTILEDTFNLTYRKIPVLAIGRDLYCDTSIICEALEHRFDAGQGYRTLYPSTSDGRKYQALIRGFASYWTDRPLFRATTGLIPASAWRTSFGQDRAQLIGHPLDADKLERKLPENLNRLDMHLSMLEDLCVENPNGWLMSTTTPSLADISVWYQLKWGSEIAKGYLIDDLTAGGTAAASHEGAEQVFNDQRYPFLSSWYKRFEDHLSGLERTESAADSSKAAIERLFKVPSDYPGDTLLPTANPSLAELDRKCGLTQGAEVSVAPDDTGRDNPTIGTLLAISPEEVVIKPRKLAGPPAVEVRVHFPRLGFVCELPQIPAYHRGGAATNLIRQADDKMQLIISALLLLTRYSVSISACADIMGGTQSAPEVMAPVKRQPARPRAPSNGCTLDEKLDAFRMDGSHSSQVLAGNSTAVSASRTNQYIKAILQDSKNRLGLSALSTHAISDVLKRPSTIVRDTQAFNVAIPHEGTPVTNQRSSGRCWIFAATNVFRIAIMQKYNIEQFELSQAYLFFWDKVEKSNYFLEQILAYSDEKDSTGRLLAELNKAPVGDGGQWDMIVNLVSKYGILPQTLYPDSFSAMNSSVMDSLITTKLREAGLVLNSLKATSSRDKILAYKESVLQDIIRILTLTLGPPPAADESFSWEFYDKNKKLKTVSITPLEFAATTEVTKFISLVNDPRHDYMRLMTVSNLGNVFDGRPVTYVNVHGDVLRAACIAMLKKGLPVWFGSDVGKQSDSQKGIMDTDLVDYELGFNVRLGMTKAQRLSTSESAMTHAMVLTAVHLDKNGKPIRWRVENSWSEDAGTKGYFVMSDHWMDEFFYQAVVEPSVVDQDVKDVLKQDPLVLPLWDPMGALA
ncbi:hypothetical protein AMS68_002814 [Peltaster fructicola]|uniref:Cysteine proteinase 1, mitochondrial n=1 Tax=Peltaster fructicola TaxID=286661 RepID=A0A6H0XRB2_9PEZI|nr:hypothetical protein AMS68_002814 [Peltaster fructicola]